MIRSYAFAAVLAVGIAIGAVAAAAGDDRAVTETVLREVAGSPKKDVAAELVTRAKAALDRGAKLREGGDEAHAKLADKLARTWAEAARDVTRAAAVEESAAAARLGTTDAGLTAERERALLEEAVAQSGRLRAQLETADGGGPAKEPAKTSKQAKDDSEKPKPAGPARDGGAPRGPREGVGAGAREGAGAGAREGAKEPPSTKGADAKDGGAR